MRGQDEPIHASRSPMPPTGGVLQTNGPRRARTGGRAILVIIRVIIRVIIQRQIGDSSRSDGLNHCHCLLLVPPSSLFAWTAQTHAVVPAAWTAGAAGPSLGRILGLLFNLAAAAPVPAAAAVQTETCHGLGHHHWQLRVMLGFK